MEIVYGIQDYLSSLDFLDVISLILLERLFRPSHIVLPMLGVIQVSRQTAYS
jgi:hypothetical protein